MFMMITGLCHIEIPDKSDYGLTVKISTSAVSIAAIEGYL